MHAELPILVSVVNNSICSQMTMVNLTILNIEACGLLQYHSTCISLLDYLYIMSCAAMSSCKRAK